MRKPGINGTLGVVLLLVAFGISAPLLYGGTQLIKSDKVEATDNGTAGGTPGGPVNVTIVAKNTSFSLKSITASAGADVSVTLDNQDAGVPHNISFYTDRSASTAIQKGNLVTGPGSEVISFKAPATAGSYYFHCDVHPDQMSGAFTVQ